MTRVKRGTTSMKRRRSVLKRTKGYRHGRRNKERQAKEAYVHAGVHAFTHRKQRKGDFRRLWQVKIGAAARKEGITYNALMHTLKQKGFALNRKMLAELAEHSPNTFKRVVENAKN